MTLKEEQLAEPCSQFEYYIEQYQEMHSKGYTEFYQLSPTFSAKKQVKAMLETCQAKTMLDYGISSGTQYTKGLLHEFLELDSYQGYDPAVEKYSEKPTKQFDAVLCYDVLEHIPEASIDYVLEDIFKYPTKLAMFKMGLGKAIAVLPSGENAHITIRKLDWWREKIKKFQPEGVRVFVHHEEI